jgi:hypothetical protein
MIVQQRYCNETGTNLEMVYTFPLAWGVTRMGMDVDIAGKRLQATVIEKQEAQQQYEKAIQVWIPGNVFLPLVLEVLRRKVFCAIWLKKRVEPVNWFRPMKILRKSSFVCSTGCAEQ